ncbi:hypothetical protein R1sor_018811 [Riccia sorocarpa]|uniref:alpha-1,2-Mannosidase n=1 Tax=Riccia sorocarpa TaxID=122646 RepID=A0ABD3IGZ7_9MARC
MVVGLRRSSMGRFQADFVFSVLLLSLVHEVAVADPISQVQAAELRNEVREMFYHAFDNYMQHAFPMDELRPLSCSGEESLGEYTLTLVDALDMLALLGDHEKFTAAVTWLGANLRFERNKTVSVFETTIRVLGGLLSGHLIASDQSTGMKVDGYQNELLILAEALGRKLLPAFDTPTGIPYGSVNLLYGVSDDESQVTSTAGGGTLTLEFGLLSRLTGDPAKNAVRGLWAQRSQLGLVGAHINVFTGEWTHKDAGIGTSIDSFYEYLLKAYLLFGDDEYLYMFKEAYKSVMMYLFHDPWYIEVNMNSAVVVWPLFNSLQAFWPGLQVLTGDIQPAVRTHRAFFAVWRKYGFTPEGFNLVTSDIQPGQRSYPLRPELIESTYMLYKATRDPFYLDVGRVILRSIQSGARCPCGYCHIADVESHVQDDHMESFFLSETVKYLWLLFDLAAMGDNLVETGPHLYIFSTEGHLFPLTPEISFRPEESLLPKHAKKHRLGVDQLKMEVKVRNQAGGHVLGDFDSLISRVNESSGGIDCTDESDLNRSLQGICQKLSLWRKLAANYLADIAAGVSGKHVNLTESTNVKGTDVVQSKASRDRRFLRDLLVSVVHTGQDTPPVLPPSTAAGVFTIHGVEETNPIFHITTDNQNEFSDLHTSAVAVGESGPVQSDSLQDQDAEVTYSLHERENNAVLEGSPEHEEAQRIQISDNSQGSNFVPVDSLGIQQPEGKDTGATFSKNVPDHERLVVKEAIEGTKSVDLIGLSSTAAVNLLVERTSD